MLNTIFTALIFLVIMGAIFWFYYMVHQKIVGEEYVRIYEPISVDTLKYMGINFLILLVSMALISLVTGFFLKNFGNQLALIDSLKHTHGWVMYFYILVFSPVFETVIISGLLGEVIAWWFIKMSIANRTPLNPMITSLVLTGFVYGSIHAAAAGGFIDYLVSMLVYGFFGAFLTYINLKTQDIRTSVLIHILYNAIGLAVVMFKM